MKTRTMFPLLVAALALAGCQTLGLHIENPSYSLRDVRPRVQVALPLSASTIDFDLDVAVNNPNSVGLRLDRVDFDLLVNGNHVLNGITDQNIRIPANGTGDVRIRTSVGYDNIKSIFREIADAINGQKASYQLQGTATYDTPVGKLQFPLTIYSSR